MQSFFKWTTKTQIRLRNAQLESSLAHMSDSTCSHARAQLFNVLFITLLQYQLNRQSKFNMSQRRTKPTIDLCDQQTLRSASTSTQHGKDSCYLSLDNLGAAEGSAISDDSDQTAWMRRLI